MDITDHLKQLIAELKNQDRAELETQDRRDTSTAYYIVRTYSAGVFAGEIVRRDGKEVEMKNARRLWYWSGANSLSELAMHGVAKPDDCKFPCEVSRVVLTEAVEILECTDKARKSIADVPVWQQ